MTDQKPIQSGFSRTSTAAEVIDGIDLSGKLAIVTGGYSGLGLESTKALVSAGANVVVPARRPDAAKDALSGIDNVEVATLDLADLDSVKTFADEFLTSGRPIHLLINYAAIMACPETRVGPGWEAQFATNHIGHFALTNRLWPALVAGKARVVALSSTGHRLSPIRFDDVDFEKGYEKWQAYGQAKTANSLFAVGLDARGKSQGVRAFAVHPGGIMTPLQRHLPKEEMIAMGWMDESGKVHEGFKSPEQGAATSVWAATSPKLEGQGGVYCEDCDISVIDDSDGARFMGVGSHAVDPAAADKLWALSVDRTGVNAFA